MDLSGSWRIFHEPPLGWTITFVRIAAGPASPIILPAVLPVAVRDPLDKALCASVVLPESSGSNQYWVPVLEKHRCAQLLTAEWVVFFARSPLP
jgi:hypothetical protein